MVEVLAQRHAADVHQVHVLWHGGPGGQQSSGFMSQIVERAARMPAQPEQGPHSPPAQRTRAKPRDERRAFDDSAEADPELNVSEGARGIRQRERALHVGPALAQANDGDSAFAAGAQPIGDVPGVMFQPAETGNSNYRRGAANLPRDRHDPRAIRAVAWVLAIERARHNGDEVGPFHPAQVGPLDGGEEPGVLLDAEGGLMEDGRGKIHAAAAGNFRQRCGCETRKLPPLLCPPRRRRCEQPGVIARNRAVGSKHHAPEA
jgi:hypothetical protein